MFKTIANDSEGIIIEKKSKFIANAFYIENEEEAEDKINELRKKHYDARHHCFAYRIYQEGQTISKQSDDGEPSGTAGGPMLNILEKQDYLNVLIIVTRYFGGILLGTGGLVKAYSDAAKEALKNCKTVEKENGLLLEIIINYDEISNFEYFCIQNNMKIVKKEYLEKIKYLIEISKENFEKKVEAELKTNYQNLPIKILEEKFVPTNGETAK